MHHKARCKNVALIFVDRRKAPLYNGTVEHFVATATAQEWVGFSKT